MDNQHRKIAGYRELNEAEIALMNEIKEFGPQLHALTLRLGLYVRSQREAVMAATLTGEPFNEKENQRLIACEPERWLAIGKTNLQQGLMALTRAVAQPEFF